MDPLISVQMPRSLKIVSFVAFLAATSAAVAWSHNLCVNPRCPAQFQADQLKGNVTCRKNARFVAVPGASSGSLANLLPSMPPFSDPLN